MANNINNNFVFIIHLLKKVNNILLSGNYPVLFKYKIRCKKLLGAMMAGWGMDANGPGANSRAEPAENSSKT
jgi:hypothetical protein